jgi:hypothetical protein
MRIWQKEIMGWAYQNQLMSKYIAHFFISEIILHMIACKLADTVFPQHSIKKMTLKQNHNKDREILFIVIRQVMFFELYSLSII